MAGIPGLDVFEIDEPKVSGVRDLATRPYEPNWTMPGAQPPGSGPAPAGGFEAPPARSQPQGWTDRINSFANNVGETGEAQRQGVRDVQQGMARRMATGRNFISAVGNATKAVAGLPIVQGAGTLLGAADAVHQAGQFGEAAHNDDNFGMANSGMRAVGSALSMAPSPVGFAAGAFRAGNMIGDKVYENAQKTTEGQGMLDGLGHVINKGLRFFGGGVDDSKMEEANNFALSGKMGIPYKPAPPPTATQPTALPSARPGVDASQYTAAPGAPAAPADPNAMTGLTRNGNSFSGSNIKFGTDTPGGSEGFRQDQLELQRNAAERNANMQTEANGFAAPPTLRDVANAQDLGPGVKERMAMNSGSVSDRHLMMQIAADRAKTAVHEGGENTRLGVREAGETGRSVLNNRTQLGMNAQRINAEMRGQDITREGHLMSSATARWQGARDQMNKDRDFTAGRDDKNFEQKQGRENQLQKNIEATNTIMVDGKPVVNAPAVAAYRAGIDRSVARLGAKGVHELSPMDEQRLMAGSDLLKTMRENANWLPWNPDKLKTVDPLDLTNLRMLPNGDRQITRADSKAAGQVIPKRFFDTEEGARMFGGTPTNKYDLLHEGK